MVLACNAASLCACFVSVSPGRVRCGARGGGNAKIRGFEPFGRPWGSFVRLKCSRLLYAAWFSAEHTGA